MQRFSLDSYVVDVLMPDLVGHDRRPATFVVYLFLVQRAAAAKRDSESRLAEADLTPGLKGDDGHGIGEIDAAAA